jgi:hypothetical protein
MERRKRRLCWVATSKTHRGLGLAELVIRTSLEDAGKSTGIERTILHATDDGFPVYLRMGYRSVVKFPLYGSCEKGYPLAPPILRSSARSGPINNEM